MNPKIVKNVSVSFLTLIALLIAYFSIKKIGDFTRGLINPGSQDRSDLQNTNIPNDPNYTAPYNPNHLAQRFYDEIYNTSYTSDLPRIKLFNQALALQNTELTKLSNTYKKNFKASLRQDVYDEWSVSDPPIQLFGTSPFYNAQNALLNRFDQLGIS